ncbi:hypothetical protein L6452_27964 [Arctium lappa]|uniref:Uncharacterized protein n=1 Tax=Arctium lappa TaxID=4217 RepID=A0ACB9A1H5_ARCLA|nr:hypothetical protein L6452_27964 [Arctium lappa]
MDAGVALTGNKNRDVVDLERSGCGGRVQRSDGGSLSAKFEIDPVLGRNRTRSFEIEPTLNRNRKDSEVVRKRISKCYGFLIAVRSQMSHRSHLVFVRSNNLVSSSESGRSKTKKEKSLAQDVKKLSSAVSSTHLLLRSKAILKVHSHNDFYIHNDLHDD